jgi:NADPH-dependent ferric siderophore reductase
MRHTTSATLAGHDPAGLLDFFAAELADHGLPFEQAQPGRYQSVMPAGALYLLRERGALRLTLQAGGLAQMHGLRDMVIEHLAEYSADLAAGLVWSDLAGAGAAPPNFRLMRALSVTRPSPIYLRVRLAGEDLHSFDADEMHFRLLLPPAGRPAEWPVLSASGQTLWPKGEAALHRPAYTIRHIEAKAGWLEFDVFRHAGGRATAWAEALRPGDAVGVIGPGGGGFPCAPWLLMAGDETALPAIARIAGRLPAQTRGHVIVELGDPAGRQPLAAPAGMRVEWRIRRGHSALFAAAQAVALPDAGRYVWFAGEKAQAQQARSWFRESRGLTADESYISGYWKAL